MMNTSGDREIVAVFCDGGVVLKNPSTIAGTWAWCGVTTDGEHIREVSGYLLPNTTTFPGWFVVDSPVVTNNEAEFYAAMRALESMKDGWCGTLVSDSQVTLTRFDRLRNGEVIYGVRRDWMQRVVAAFRRVEYVKLKHVAGHPTELDLTRRYMIKDGKKVQVSRHQVWCDHRCTWLRKNYIEQLSIFGVPYEAPKLESAEPTPEQRLIESEEFESELVPA